MSEIKIERTSENAVKLLAAAEVLELGPEVVKTIPGAYLVPEEVAKEAKLKAKVEEPVLGYPFTEVTTTEADAPGPSEGPEAGAAEKKPAARAKGTTKKE